MEDVLKSAYNNNNYGQHTQVISITSLSLECFSETVWMYVEKNCELAEMYVCSGPFIKSKQ